MTEGPGVDWRSSAADIAGAVSEGKLPFTYLKGARITLVEAEPREGGPEGEPGSIVSLEPDGSFTVVAGVGSLRVTRSRISFYTHETDDLNRVIEVFELALPQRTGPVPYLDNRDPTVWERAVRRWGSERVDWRLQDFVPADSHPNAGLIEPNLPYFSWLFDAAAIDAQGWCLDIGCGDGWAMEVFRRLGHPVAGFDVAEGALATARRSVQGAVVDELDYYEAGEHYEKVGLDFDFMICRHLGIAQKLVDWSDGAWSEATTRLAGRLRTGGMIFWSQLSDRTGLLSAHGMRNDPARTLLDHFRGAGLRPLALNVFGAIFVLMLVREDFPEDRRRRFESINESAWRAAFDLYRTEVHRPPGGGQAIASRDVIANGFRAACGLLSRLLIEPGENNGRLVIAGSDPVAQLFGRAALLLRIPVSGYWSRLGSDGPVGMDGPVGKMGDFLEGEPAPIVLLAEAELEEEARTALAGHRAARLVSPWTAKLAASGHVYLIDGDHDQVLLEGVRSFMAGFADWEND